MSPDQSYKKDFKGFKKFEKNIVSPKLILKLEIELIDSSLTVEEAAARLQYLLDGYNLPEFSNLITRLLRETRSSLWDLKKLELE